MSKASTPTLKLVSETTIEVGGLTLRLCVLSNGERTIDAEDFEAFVRDCDPSEEDVEALLDALATRN